MFSDHAVLQRDRPIHVWGWDLPGQSVRVQLGTESKTSQVDDLGHWSVWLMPMPAGGPYVLDIEDGKSGKTFSDIYLGDVWVASGQSNMVMPLKGFPNFYVQDSAKEIAAANHPDIRLLMVDEASSTFPKNDIGSEGWKLCSPESAPPFSAVAYFFGRELAEHEHVKIGLIESAWGGTPVESWMSFEGLAASTESADAFAIRGIEANKVTDREDELARYKRVAAEAVAKGQKPPTAPWYSTEDPLQMAALYNGMIAPLTPYTIKGVIWYQGETNTPDERASSYASLFPAMIQDWRTHWGEGDFPFLFVQLPSVAGIHAGWAVVRDAQRRTLSVANTGMAATLDLGKKSAGAHPPDKQDVGHRLALVARARVYGEAVEYSGPLFRQMTREGHGLRLWFDHAEGLSGKGGELKGFEVAGPDGVFREAKASLDHDSILVESLSVSDPVTVRYGGMGWADGYIVNSSGLTAPSFIASVPRR